ncbi:MAG: thioredoxin family protein [Betaproteobacteria bacterium]|nr:thioredoxin family protein [Betaproteobacteria bacterium]
MKQVLLASLVAATVSFVMVDAASAATIGQPAPAFSLKDTNGKTVNLADYKGKTVVLEWHNPACPFVVKHYDTSNMQGLQSKYGKDGVVWLSVNSTETGHQDYKKPDALNVYLKAQNAAPAAYLMDESGATGKAYAAKTTPHMYVINPQGTLVYAGGIDDKRSSKKEDVATAKNFVSAALDELKAGKPITTATSAPYGCSIKYKS